VSLACGCACIQRSDFRETPDVIESILVVINAHTATETNTNPKPDSNHCYRKSFVCLIIKVNEIHDQWLIVCVCLGNVLDLLNAL